MSRRIDYFLLGRHFPFTLTVLLVFDHPLKMNAFPMAIAGLNSFDGAPCAWWPRRSLRLRGSAGYFFAQNLVVGLETKLNRQVNRSNRL